MARPTDLLGLVRELTSMPSVEKRVEVSYTADGIAALVRTKDGNAYEFTIRPAEYAKHPTLKRKT